MPSTNSNTTHGDDDPSEKTEDTVVVLTAGEEAVVKDATDISLSVTKKCSTAKALATVIAALIGDRFAMTQTHRTALLKDLIQYFSHAGVINDEIFAFMTDPTSWPDPFTAGKNDTALTQITVPVKLLLCQLASKATRMLTAGYFFSKVTSYSHFDAWIVALDASDVPSVKVTTGTKTDSKIPAFRVPSFKGITLDGDKYMDDVVRSFTNHALSQYILDVQYCESNISWSGAFASRIRESVAHSDTLGYLATEQENENNCATLWGIVCQTLTSSELTMARAMSLWNQVFGLKCDTRDDFQHFYSKVKALLFKLKKDDSVAVTDDVFLRAYFAKVIQAPELQTEVKKLISDKEGTYESILQLIHDDYRAQETGDALRDVPITTGKSARRGKPTSDEPTRPPKRIKIAAFPNNEDRLIPSHFFTQMKTWYDHMVVPKEDRNAATKLWMTTFRWDFKNPNRQNFSHYQGDRDGYRGDKGRDNYSRRHPGSNNDDRRHPSSNNDDRRSRRSYNDSPVGNRDQDYEDFLAWKTASTDRQARRGRSEEDSNVDVEDEHRRRRASMFRTPP